MSVTIAVHSLNVLRCVQGKVAPMSVNFHQKLDFMHGRIKAIAGPELRVLYQNAGGGVTVQFADKPNRG